MTNISNYYIENKNKLISDKDSYITGNKYRFTVLSPRMIRLEYSSNGVFEDRPTSLVINRSFPKVRYSITESNTLIQIDTGIFTLTYVKDSEFKSTTFGSNIKALHDLDYRRDITLDDGRIITNAWCKNITKQEDGTIIATYAFKNILNHKDFE